jgi:hypothetical protein
MDVGKTLPSTTYKLFVPQTRKSRETTLCASLAPILFVFSTEILTAPLSKRLVIRLPVADLGVIVGQLTVEHIYDY